MTNKYIVLADSVSSISKRFRVIGDGFETPLEKTSTVNRAVNGGIDVCMGSIFEQFNGVIRVRHTETETDYGSLSDLEALYRLTDPNPTSGSPSNIITMTDHHGTTKNVYFVGRFPKRYISVELEGTQAWLLVPVTFLVIP